MERDDYMLMIACVFLGMAIGYYFAPQQSRVVLIVRRKTDESN